ncbi:hypothetical protein Mgra_00002520 [Meloidogyne graminicola]|uniref:ShKT domain-containing protein n=1 Tax=Meloidogyne graminicola TaxID=189291 RepID=A0A8S9ZY24_9BILA|nr:hypothetical protein Mgra_00002518 [Meloidogyne graminicola]KAF7638067.1 hypothetical protein Mgra_00002520 [Meloidogyne graminicola]
MRTLCPKTCHFC